MNMKSVLSIQLSSVKSKLFQATERDQVHLPEIQLEKRIKAEYHNGNLTIFTIPLIPKLLDVAHVSRRGSS